MKKIFVGIFMTLLALGIWGLAIFGTEYISSQTSSLLAVFGLLVIMGGLDKFNEVK